MTLGHWFVGLVLSVVVSAQSSEPPPQMQSVGVRGAVDGAGYSAAATAKAQSTISRLLMDLQFRALQQTIRNAACSLCTAEDRQGFEAELNQQFGAAADHFQAALNCSPTAENRFAYGTALVLLNKPDAAREAFADPQNANSALGHTGFALVLYQQGQSAAALNETLSIIEQHVEGSLASFVLLSIVSNPALEVPEDVRVRLRRLSTVSAQDAPLLTAEAMIDFREHDAQAAQLLERAIELDPSIAEAHTLLAQIYTDDRQYDRAIEQYRAALSARNGDASLHYRLGQVYLLSGRRELGEAELNAYRSMREATPETLSRELRSLVQPDVARACTGSDR